jgi:hypothetical protein
MKSILSISAIIATSIASFQLSALTTKTHTANYKETEKNLYLDVHHVSVNLKYDGIVKSHAKDVMASKQNNVDFLDYWINEKEGLVFCLLSASDTLSIKRTYAQGSGMPASVFYKVTEGTAAALKGKKSLYFDIHYLGAGKVTAKDVAGAHEKDLAIQAKHDVNLINYWVDEEDGVVMCLAQAKDSTSFSETHKEAHGLIASRVIKVKQGK